MALTDEEKEEVEKINGIKDGIAKEKAIKDWEEITGKTFVRVFPSVDALSMRIADRLDEERYKGRRKWLRTLGRKRR